jgi:hypothetical protein
MLNNGFAVLLVVLCILPNTAPLSSIAAVRSSTAHTSGAGIHEDTRVPPLADPDSNDAIACKPIDPLACSYVLRV